MNFIESYIFQKRSRLPCMHLRQQLSSHFNWIEFHTLFSTLDEALIWDLSALCPQSICINLSMLVCSFLLATAWKICTFIATYGSHTLGRMRRINKNRILDYFQFARDTIWIHKLFPLTSGKWHWINWLFAMHAYVTSFVKYARRWLFIAIRVN